MMTVIEQTREEKIAMYMDTPKEKLAEMLFNCNEVLSKLEMQPYKGNINSASHITWSTSNAQ